MIELPPGFYESATRLLVGPRGSLHLSDTYHRLICQIGEANGAVVTYHALSTALWGHDTRDAERSLKVWVFNLRGQLRQVGIERYTIATAPKAGGYHLNRMPVPPAVVISPADRRELEALLSSHPQHSRATALMQRILGSWQEAPIAPH